MNGTTPPKIRLPPPKARPTNGNPGNENPHEPTFGFEHEGTKLGSFTDEMERWGQNSGLHLQEVAQHSGPHEQRMSDMQHDRTPTQAIGQSTLNWPELGKAPTDMHPRPLAPVPVLQHAHQCSEHPTDESHAALVAPQHHVWPAQQDPVVHASARPRPQRHIQPCSRATSRTPSPVFHHAGVGQAESQKPHCSPVLPVWSGQSPHKAHQIELNAGIVDPQPAAAQFVRVFPMPQQRHWLRQDSFNSVDELDFSGSESVDGSCVRPKWRVEGRAGNDNYTPPALPSKDSVHGHPSSCASRSLATLPSAAPKLSHKAEHHHPYSPNKRSLEAGRRVSTRHGQLQHSNRLSNQEAQMALVATELHRESRLQDYCDRYSLSATPMVPHAQVAASSTPSGGVSAASEATRRLGQSSAQQVSAGSPDQVHTNAKREVDIDGLVDADHLMSQRAPSAVMSQPHVCQASTHAASSCKSTVAFDRPRANVAIDHGPPTPWEEELAAPGMQEASCASSSNDPTARAASVASPQQHSVGSHRSDDASQYSDDAHSRSSEAVQGEVVSSQHSRQSVGSGFRSMYSETPEVTTTQRSVSVTSAAVTATARDLWQAEAGPISEATDVQAIFCLPSSPNERLSATSPCMEASSQLSREQSGSAHSSHHSGANTPTVSFGGAEEVSAAARSRASRSSDGDVDHPSDDEYWEGEEEEEEWFEDEEEEESEAIDEVED